MVVEQGHGSDEEVVVKDVVDTADVEVEGSSTVSVVVGPWLSGGGQVGSAFVDAADEEVVEGTTTVWVVLVRVPVDVSVEVEVERV